jgi:hypothetical protein
MAYSRKKAPRRTTRRRLQAYTPKQKNAILKEAARAVAGGYATVRRMSGKSPKRTFAQSVRKSPSGMYTDAKDQGLADYKKSRAKYGKRATIAALTRKATRMNLNTTVYSIYNYGPWNRGSGNLMIRSNQSGAAGTDLIQPIHLWELNGVPQGQAADIKFPAAFYELGFNNETSSGAVKWYTHVNNAATTATGLDQSAGLFSPNYNPHLTYTDKIKDLNLQNYQGPGTDDILEKVRCTMVLNGPQQRSTKWCIQIVQLSEEVTPGIGDATSNENTAFWQAMARPYGFSPLETGPRKELRKNIKVLKTVEYIMDSPESNEDHLTSRMRHVDFSMYFNRKQSYRWGRINDLTNMNVQDVPNDQIFGPNVFSTKVEPKARIYLMIRALCQYQGPNVAPTNAVYPSYDIKLDITHKSVD